MTSVAVMTAVLLLGAWSSTGGAARPALPTYSEEDCTTLTNIQVDDASGGYWGKTALNASDAFKGAAADIESKKLRASMNTLAKVWRIVGRKRNAIAAAQATAHIGNRYTTALGVYTKALTSCSTQALTATTEPPSSSDEGSSSTDDTSSTEDTSSSSDSSE